LLHVPFVEDSTTPCCGGDGETVGKAVFTGAGGTTVLLAADVAAVLPPAFVAVTITLSVCPTSPATGV
jgi:hypothetical protein